MQLTPQGTQAVEEIARRYSVSTDAVATLLQAVVNGGGSMAQFNHPELGGGGQWMRGGMTMVGDMFNNNLKNLVDNLCTELSGLVGNASLFEQPPQNDGSYSQGGGFGGNASGQWWPEDLGFPSSSGSQNNFRYAIFPASRRLAVDLGGQVTIYDTLDHQIGGVGQQQGYGASFSFTSQYGAVNVDSLPIVSGVGHPPEYAQQPANEASVYEPVNAEEGDIFAKIERLAELLQKGMLSEAEFASKKAELLSRL